MRTDGWVIGDYTPQSFARVRQTCLHVACVLGDWMEQVTLIGGVVPSLLIPQDHLPFGVDPHPGTADLDLGLALAVLHEEGYASIAELLRAAGYRAETKEEDRLRRQTWRTDPKLGPKVTIDFLIPRSPETAPAVRLQNLDTDFAAIIADGLHLVSRDRRAVRIQGLTLRGERAERTIWVCGPATFVVLKARAIHLREKPKDAYDLHYVLANVDGSVAGVVRELRPLLDDGDARQAMAFLAEDYRTVDSIGPTRAAVFVHGPRGRTNGDDVDELRASAFAYVQRLLGMLA